MEIDGNIVYVDEDSTTLDKIVKLKVTSSNGYSKIIYNGKQYKPGRDYGTLIFYSSGEHKGIKKPYKDDKNYEEDIEIWKKATDEFFGKDVAIDYSIQVSFTLIAGEGFTDTLRFNATCPNEKIDEIIEEHTKEIQKEYTERVYGQVSEQYKKYI